MTIYMPSRLHYCVQIASWIVACCMWRCWTQVAVVLWFVHWNRRCYKLKSWYVQVHVKSSMLATAQVNLFYQYCQSCIFTLFDLHLCSILCSSFLNSCESQNWIMDVCSKLAVFRVCLVYCQYSLVLTSSTVDNRYIHFVPVWLLVASPDSLLWTGIHVIMCIIVWKLLCELLLLHRIVCLSRLSKLTIVAMQLKYELNQKTELKPLHQIC